MIVRLRAISTHADADHYNQALRIAAAWQNACAHKGNCGLSFEYIVLGGRRSEWKSFLTPEGRPREGLPPLFFLHKDDDGEGCTHTEDCLANIPDDMHRSLTRWCPGHSAVAFAIEWSNVGATKSDRSMAVSVA